jgi:MFS transporter, OFA family, oxalate/formate antiporter
MPLTNAYGATVSYVNLAFSITIFTLVFATFAGNGLFVLCLTYGFLGGFGIGLGYIVPIATLVKWFLP